MYLGMYLPLVEGARGFCVFAVNNHDRFQTEPCFFLFSLSLCARYTTNKYMSVRNTNVVLNAGCLVGAGAHHMCHYHHNSNTGAATPLEQQQQQQHNTDKDTDTDTGTAEYGRPTCR